MLKGEGGFFLLIILCLAVAGSAWTALRPSFPALPTSEYVETDETEYSPGSPRCYPSRLNSLPSREAADERYRCETQADKHRLEGDDLVQQTRAANAAEAVVSLSYRQLLLELAGTIFGVLTVLAALYAAFYARKAVETGQGANAILAEDFRITNKPLLRVSATGAYVDEKITPLNQLDEGGRGRDIKILTRLTLTNVGAPSAFIETTDVFLGEPGRESLRHPPDVISDMLLSGERIPLHASFGRGQGEQNPRAVLQHAYGEESQVFAMFTLTRENREQFMREPWPIQGVVRYRDVIGNRYELGFAFRPSSAWVGEPYSKIDGFDNLIGRTEKA